LNDDGVDFGLDGGGVTTFCWIESVPLFFKVVFDPEEGRTNGFERGVPGGRPKEEFPLDMTLLSSSVFVSTIVSGSAISGSPGCFPAVLAGLVSADVFLFRLCPRFSSFRIFFPFRSIVDFSSAAIFRLSVPGPLYRFEALFLG
jgi:hypothetical protein